MIRVRLLLGTQKMRVWVILGTCGLCPGGREPTSIWAINSLSSSNNQPRLTYIWMYVCWDVHQDTKLDIWIRRVIIIRCQDNNSLCFFANWVISLALPQLFSLGFYFGFPVLLSLVYFQFTICVPLLWFPAWHCSCFTVLILLTLSLLILY